MSENPNFLSGKDTQRPSVILREIKKEKTFNSHLKAHYNISDTAGNLIGSFQVEFYYSWTEVRNIWHSTPASEITAQPKTAMITTIKIHDAYRGKGYGKSAYLEILKLLGRTPLISGTTLTGGDGKDTGSYEMWQSLVRDGHAIGVKKDGELVSFISVPVGFVGTPEDLEQVYWQNN